MTDNQGKGGGLGALMSGGKLLLKGAIGTAMNNRGFVDYAAASLYTEETGADWSKLPANEKALWRERVGCILRVLGRSFGADI